MQLDMSPGKRLTTQNLVLSAADALEGEGQTSWTAVQDLATLIDLFCMCDEASVLGRPMGTAFESALGNLLGESQFLQIETPPMTGAYMRIPDMARQHLFTFLGTPPSEAFDDLLNEGFRPAPSFVYSVNSADDLRDMAVGERWLKTAAASPNAMAELSREPEMARRVTLVIRSFLYVAFGELTGKPFVPDVVRTQSLMRVARAEDDLRSLLVEAVKKGSDSRRLSESQTLQRVSPFASIVFARAKGDRRRLLDEMDLLRSKLAKTRKRLRDAERIIFFGQGSQVSNAQQEWKAVAKELTRTFGREPRLVSLQQIVGWGRDAGDLIDEPRKTKSWLQFALALPADVLTRVLNRRRAVEIHSLQRELPGQGAAGRALKKLFGEIRE
jgi:hypothetical protein